MSAFCPAMRVVSDAGTPPADWDTRAVEVPGGHIMQSATWGAYRAGQGFEPRYLTFDDDHVALVLLRRSAGLPGAEAIVRRGPAQAGAEGSVAAARGAALATWARGVGARSLFLDPAQPADPAYAQSMATSKANKTAPYAA